MDQEKKDECIRILNIMLHYLNLLLESYNSHRVINTTTDSLFHMLYTNNKRIHNILEVSQIISEMQSNGNIKKLNLALKDDLGVIYLMIKKDRNKTNDDISYMYSNINKYYKELNKYLLTQIKIPDINIRYNSEELKESLEIYLKLFDMILTILSMNLIANTQENNDKVILRFNIRNFEEIHNFFSNSQENDDDDDREPYKKKIDRITLLSSYYEANLRIYKQNIVNIKSKMEYEFLKDMCDYVITILDTYLIPFNLNLQLEVNNSGFDERINKDTKFFDNYLIDNIKIYNPSPCKISDEMDAYKGFVYQTKHKQKYKFYYFANTKKIYYYSIFYKIDIKYFLNTNTLDNGNFDLYQCLIMNSEFKGNDSYKYGKFLVFLNKMLLPAQPEQVERSRILCFVNNTKKIVDVVFKFLKEYDLFQTNEQSTLPPATPASTPQIQSVRVDSDECKYLVYDNVSFYVKQDADDKHINLILKQFQNKNSI